MMQYQIATVVNFCSNEACFLKPCLDEALKFSSRVVVAVSDHFFDGDEENMPLLQKLFSEHKEVLFLLYPYMPAAALQKNKIYQKVGEANFWHSLSRLIGFSALDQKIEYTLFLDADEIADGKLFKAWLDTGFYKGYNALRPANYWYFRDSCFRAKKFEDSAVLIKNSAVALSSLLRKSEREAIFEEAADPKIRNVLFQEKPLLHHYSWVRTKEQMLKKVKSWGHKNDRLWPSLIEKEFSQEFQGTDFVHGYKFDKVAPFYQIDLLQPVLPKSQDFLKKSGNVCFFSIKEVLKLIEKSQKKTFFCGK